MLRLSRMTDYGVLVLTHLSRDGCGVMTAQEVADGTGLPSATVAKLLKQLARGGLVRARRGATGGYQIDRPATAITVYEVLTVLEGERHLVDCVDGTSGLCAIESSCAMRGRWDPVHAAVRTALEGVTLADIIAAQLMAPSIAHLLPEAGERLRFADDRARRSAALLES